MGTTRDKNAVRQLSLDCYFDNLNDPMAGPRLTRVLQRILEEISIDRAIESLPAPSGLTATSMAASVLLEWDELPESFRSSFDGARIWRCNQDDDPEMDFNANGKKQIVVPLVRATSYTDPVGNNGTMRTYWVQWISLDGVASKPSQGVTQAALWDSGAPGAVSSLSVTGADGMFKGSWRDPLTNINTLDGFAQQYSTSSTYSASLTTTLWWGKIYHHEGVDPNKAYYFRYAGHNLSGDTTSNTNTQLAAIYSSGWGPWADAPLNPVSSGQLPGVGVDTVIPGILANLEVWGSNGDFLASWEDPATGNLGIKDIAEEYSLSRTSWVRVESKTLRWGNTRFLRGSRPNTSYHFRFAARNNSNTTSATAGPGGAGEAFAGELGWGPWTYYGPAGSTITMTASVTVNSGQVSFQTGDTIKINATDGIVVSTTLAGTVVQITKEGIVKIDAIRPYTSHGPIDVVDGSSLSNIRLDPYNQRIGAELGYDLTVGPNYSGTALYLKIYNTTICTLTENGIFQSSGTFELSSTASTIMIGNGADGSWRIALVGDNLLFQQRESSSWVTKSTISGA